MRIVIPRGSVLRWQFPEKCHIRPSRLVTGLVVLHHIGEHSIWIHFACNSADKARVCRKWIPKLPASKAKRGSLLSVVLRPAPHGVVNCDSFASNERGDIILR